MVNHIWSVLCKESVINQENNALSLMNIFEGLQINVKEGAPKNVEINIPLQYEIVTLLRKDHVKEEKVVQRVTLIDPSGVVIGEPINIPIALEKNMVNHRQRIKALGFRITVPGTYKFIVELQQQNSKKFDIVSTFPVDITVNK